VLWWVKTGCVLMCQNNMCFGVSKHDVFWWIKTGPSNMYTFSGDQNPVQCAGNMGMTCDTLWQCKISCSRTLITKTSTLFMMMNVEHSAHAEVWASICIFAFSGFSKQDNMHACC
jgi:hypothetical protein